MKIEGIGVRYASRACIEICFLFLVILLSFQFIAGHMLRSRILARIVSGEREQPARLYRLFERQHYAISPYDDVGLGEIDTPLYVVQTQSEPTSARRLTDADFLVIDRGRLDREFRENGRGVCASCPYRQADVPFMNVMIRVLPVNAGSAVTIAGYERRGYSLGQWGFAGVVFVVASIYFLVVLVFAWNYLLRDLASALVGIPPQDEWRFLLPQRFSLQKLTERPNNGLVYLAAMILILGFLPLALATRIVWAY